MIGTGPVHTYFANPTGYIYINGDEKTDGSRRFSVDPDTGMAVIEKLIDGLWQPASFETGPNSLWVGRNVGIAGVGHHLVTESADGHLHFHAHSEYDKETCITDAQIVNVYNFTERLVYQPDESGSWTGTNYEFISPAPDHTIVTKGYLKTDITAATKPVRIQTWTGTDDTGDLIFNQWYPASNFLASSEIDIEYVGALEFETGNNYFTRYSSEADFSMKMNAAGTFPWVAADLGMVREENLLQTMDYIDGENYTKNQYLIKDRNIYICNVTGVQTGTWEDNSDKWDRLDSALPWSKSMQTTGLLEGGLITNPNPFVLNWTAGSGRITDLIDPTNPAIHEVSWDAVNGYSPTHIGTSGQYIITYNSDGDIEELLAADIGPELVRSNIVIGGFSVSGPYIFRVVDSAITLGYNTPNSFKDFMRDVIGPANIQGNNFSANGANLSLDKDEGIIFVIGTNFRNSTTVTDEKTLAVGTKVSFSRVSRQAPPSQDMLPDGAGMVDVINPTQWDDGSGVLQSVGNKYTIPVVYIMPGGGVIVVYGQQLFNQESAAQLALSQGTLQYEEYPVLLNFVRRTFIIVQGSETDLTNAIFTHDSKFRIGGISGGGVSAHNSLDNLEWDVASHTFEDAGVFDIGDYSFITTNYIAGKSLTVAGEGTDGSTLLNFNMIRRWAFQQEGSGTACALRLRNTLGQNKNFFIDTDGNTSWRNYDGSGLHTTINSSGFWGKLGSTVVATTQSPLDNSTKIATTEYADTASGSNLWTKISTTLKNNSGVDTFEFHDGIRVRLAVTPSASHMRSPNSENIVWVDNSGTAIIGKLTVNLNLIVEGKEFYIGDPDTDGTGLIKMEGNEIEFWTRVGGVYNKVGGFS